MIGAWVERLRSPSSLSPRSVRELFDLLIDGKTTEAERTALLVALAHRPPSVAELVSAARELRLRARPFPVPKGDRPIDLCGSGGARRASFNISTVSAFVVAAAGVPVVKHGNRSFRGGCGSSDLLDALGLPVLTSHQFPKATYRALKLAFLHAPLFHPATAAVKEARRIVGVPTWFNLLGPLSNPARVPYQVVGARDPDVARLYTEVLPRLGVRRGATLTSPEGCDEFSPRRPSTVHFWDGRRAWSPRIEPLALLRSGERSGPWDALAPVEAARETRRLLEGGGSGGRRGSILLTSGVALWAAGRTSSVADGVELARTTIDSGEAQRILRATLEIGRACSRGAG